MRASIISMMKKGIVAFSDFREGGSEGVELLKQAMSELPIKCIVLGRTEYYFDLTKDLKIAKKVDQEICQPKFLRPSLRHSKSGGWTR